MDQSQKKPLFSQEVETASHLSVLESSSDLDLTQEGVVSFQADLPIPLNAAMTNFIERYPNWDQYRLIQAALAGFLVQHGVESRQITRLYIGNMFNSEFLINGS